jgi:hypothetical protein
LTDIKTDDDQEVGHVIERGQEVGHVIEKGRQAGHVIVEGLKVEREIAVVQRVGRETDMVVKTTISTGRKFHWNQLWVRYVGYNLNLLKIILNF